MAPMPSFFGRLNQRFAKTWHETMKLLALPMFALSCTLWEAVENLVAFAGVCTVSRRHRRAKRPAMLSFPARWLVFGAIMLLPGGMCPAQPHPLNKVSFQAWSVKSAAFQATYSQYRDLAKYLGTTPREVWEFNVTQCLDTGVEKESYDNNVNLVLSSEVEYFVDAVEELDPSDEFLEAVQFLGDPEGQVSEAVWPDMVDVSGYPTPTFEEGHTY